MLGFVRPGHGGVLVLANVGDVRVTLRRERFQALPRDARGLVSRTPVDLGADVEIPALTVLWLALGTIDGATPRLVEPQG